MCRHRRFRPCKAASLEAAAPGAHRPDPGRVLRRDRNEPQP
ncbi:hypothetical protein [Azospirillum palustre]